MPFRLTYRGSLKSDGPTGQKHELRKHFHIQLKKLWDREPLLSYRARYLECDPGAAGKAIYRVDGVDYACLVTERLFLHCELDILFLRPSPPGSIIGTGGDIDNRLKTLFDGLRRPNENEVPHRPESTISDVPFHCLLSDDALISKVSVATDQLLEPALEGHVHLVIGVTVVPHDVVRENVGYLR